MGSTISKIARNYQVTLPREIRKRCNLKEGDMVSFEIRNSEIILNPVCVVKKNQAYFFSADWQKMIKQSEGEIKRGHYRTYKSSKALESDIEEK